MTLLPKFQEEYSAKIPALTLLHKLGWKFLSPEQALDARNGRSRHPASRDISTSMCVTSEVVLRDSLRAELRKRRFTIDEDSKSKEEAA